jgi:hypothetical protein
MDRVVKVNRYWGKNKKGKVKKEKYIGNILVV